MVFDIQNNGGDALGSTSQATRHTEEQKAKTVNTVNMIDSV